ncbi:MAG: sporulation protein YqfD [Clostridia bacterium]
MILYLLNFLKGVLKISVKGSYIERFFNVCAKNDIAIWNIKKIDIDEVQVNILLEDYTKLREFIPKTKCEIFIISKKGMPYVMSKLRYRYAFISGFFMCFITYYILTNYLFAIEIVGTEKTSMIYDMLEENDITIGTKISTINVTQAKNNIILHNDEILWLAINIKGNMATVNVFEREETPTIVEKDVPCDIIADKTGLIDSIEVLYGEKIVDVGQTFLKGDVLVSSEVVNYPQIEEIEQRYVHSIANIKASVWYNITRYLPSEIYLKNYTGREYSDYTLVFGKKAINLIENTRNSYAFYDKIVYTQKITLSKSVTVPVYLKVETYTEYTPETYKITEQTAFEILENSIKNKLQENIDGSIITEKNTESVTDNLISLNMYIQTLENIGIEREK